MKMSRVRFLPRAPGGRPSEQEVSVLSDFKKFILRGNIVDLAVAVVVGLAFTALVTAFVKDLVTPLIAAIFGKPDFSALTFTVNNSTFRYGEVINALLSFLIIA